MYQQILITWVKGVVDAMIWLRHDLMVESYSIKCSTTSKRENFGSLVHKCDHGFERTA